MARPLSIAIVGAGMGGLAAAAALRRVGIDVTVYEQATQFARLGAGIQIGCNAMKVLRGLGLEQRLRAQSFYPRSWNNRDWRTGEVKFDMIFGESAEQKFGAPYLLAHRGDLHAALASAVPDECVKLNHKLVGLDETGDGVRLTFANGATRDRRRRDRRRWHSFGRARHSVRCLAGELYRAHRLPHDLSGRAARRRKNRRLHQMVGRGPPHRHLLRQAGPQRDLSRHQPAGAGVPDRVLVGEGRRQGIAQGVRQASTARSNRCWPRARTCTNGRSSIAIRWSAGRSAT